MKYWILLFPLLGLFACGAKYSKLSHLETPSYEQRSGFEDANSGTSSPASPPSRKLTYVATLGLKAKEPSEVEPQIVAVAQAMGGYLMSGSETMVNVRVPADSLQAALSAIARLGKVLHRQVEGQDITDQHSDLHLHLDNAQKSRLRYLQLLDKANSVSEILPIEKELERLNREIEQLQGQIKRLDEAVAYSTIHVYLEKKIRPGPVGWVFYGLWKGVKFLFVWD